MTSAQARAVVAVEVFVEEEQVAPVRVALELFGVAEDGASASRWVTPEDADQAVG